MNLYIFIIVLSILVLGIGNFSRRLKNRWFISVPLIAVFAGVLIGPDVTGLIQIGSWKENSSLLLETTRITLAISLMGVALRIPKKFLKKFFFKMFIYIFVMMVMMFAASAAMVYLLLGTDIWIALIIGAIITPTDPVVASAIVTGDNAKKNIPKAIRNLISTESGANDGLAIMFFSIPLFVISTDTSNIFYEMVKIIAWDVIVPAIIGFGIGWASGRCLECAEKKNLVDKTYFLGYSIAVSLLTLGVSRLIESNAVFAVFAAGIAFSSEIKGSERHEEENVQEAINHFFVIPVFILFGMLLPWESWLNQDPVFYLLLPGVLFIRRLPWIFLISPLMKLIKTLYDKIFTGWFGPIGVAAIFYLSYAGVELENEVIWNVGSFMIFASIFFHGITASIMTKRYKKNTSL